MAKIAFDYYDAAEKMAEKGEYESALHYYFLERNAGQRDCNVEIADVYGAMGIISEAIKYYMRAFNVNRMNNDALRGLVYCFKDIDEDAAYYYMDRALRLDLDDEFGDFEYEDDFVNDYEPSLTVHDRRDKSEVLDEAFRLLENGDLDDARELLTSIDKDSYQYSDALLALASIEPEADGEKVLRLVQEAIAVDPRNLRAHLFKIVYYAHKNDNEMLEKSMRDLDELDFKDEDDVYKVAMCFCNYNRYDLAEKYILRKLEFTPYDKAMMIGLGTAMYNKGDKSGALKTIERVCHIYPDDIEAKEIASFIMSDEQVDLHEKLLKLRQEWKQYIKNLFLEDVDNITDPESIKRIKWLLQSDDDIYLQSAVCTFVAGLPEYNKLMDDVLLDPFAQTIIKKQILLRRLADTKTKILNFVVSDILRTVKVKHPRVEDNLKFAYYYVFVSLAVTEIRFEDDLYRSLKKVSDAYKNCQDENKTKLPVKALAAILYYLTMEVTAKTSCEYFDCEAAEFNEAVGMLGLKGVENVQF